MLDYFVPLVNGLIKRKEQTYLNQMQNLHHGIRVKCSREMAIDHNL